MKTKNVALTSILAIGVSALICANHASAEDVSQQSVVSAILQDKGILEVKEDPAGAGSEVYANFDSIDKAIESNAKKIDELSLSSGGSSGQGGGEVSLNFSAPLHVFKTGALSYTADRDCFIFGTMCGIQEDPTISVNGTVIYRTSYGASNVLYISPLKIYAGDVVTVSSSFYEKGSALGIYEERNGAGATEAFNSSGSGGNRSTKVSGNLYLGGGTEGEWETVVARNTIALDGRTSLSINYKLESWKRGDTGYQIIAYKDGVATTLRNSEAINSRHSDESMTFDLTGYDRLCLYMRGNYTYNLNEYLEYTIE